MPTYDYRCKSCGHEFEHFQNMSDRLLRKCPECEKNSLERLIGTGAGLIFKGSGFYITDYRGDSYKNDKKKENGGTSSPSGSDSASKKESSDGSTGSSSGGGKSSGSKSKKSGD